MNRIELIRGLNNLKPDHRDCVLTIGNYDGLHKGHQAMLARLRERAREAGVPSTVMSFEPMPREFFDPDGSPARLSSLREKIEDLAAFDVDRLLCLRFDRSLAAVDPSAFVQDLVIQRLRPRYILVGADFRFGRNRAGDVNLLADYGRRHGFEVATLPDVCDNGERVSSTRVRDALAAGDTKRAERLLGRPYRMSGRVARGEQLGRQLGVPTANIRLGRRPAPCFGVYAVDAILPGGERVPGAANLGIRPTVGGRACLLEVHLIGYRGNLYGERIDVRFRSFLRPEARFETTDALRSQMLADIERASEILDPASPQ